MRTIGRISRLSAAAVILFAVCAHPSDAEAHELGKMEVRAVFAASGRYRIEAIVDPDATLTKLRVLSGGMPESMDATSRDGELGIRAHQFLEFCSVRFDGRQIVPAIEYLPPRSSGARVTPAVMRITGTAPEGATTFEWSYGLVYGSYPLTVNVRDHPAIVRWVAGAGESATVDLVSTRNAGSFETAKQYLRLGFTHILPKGLDHSLFVLGIFLLSTKLRPVLVQVTTFTVAHSITLGLTVYGVLTASPSVVEPLIALSIAYVAAENLLTSELKPWRLGLVFSFGLLHGMGFAGVLKGTGIAALRIPHRALELQCGSRGRAADSHRPGVRSGGVLVA